MSDDESEKAAEPYYMFRPSLMGAPREFRLTPDALFWQIGRHSGRIPYDRITRVRMSFRPITMQTQRFQTEVKAPNTPTLLIASTSWKNMVEHERRDAAYSKFVAELHRRIAAAGGTPLLECGAQPFLYWPGVVVFVFIAIGMAVLIVRGLQTGSIAGAAFVAAFLALFLWQSGSYFRNNRPGRYSADALPPQLLPGR